MNPIPEISNIIIMGDSLSDRGTMYRRTLLGCIPMRLFTDLQADSPMGSFTNGYPWSDDFLASLANEFTIKKIAIENKLDATDIADAIINHDTQITGAIGHYYDLKNDTAVTYSGHNFARTYCEGGLTAYSYKWWPSTSFTRYASRMLMASLADKRDLLTQSDIALKLEDEEKARTLIIEWSGANDLFTVNAKPTQAEADRAIAARMANANKLIAQGYRNIIFFNLPDLSLTPFYQASTPAEQANAKKWSLYFNAQLSGACAALQQQLPDCVLDVFDVNSEFTEMYNHPSRYRLDLSKRSQPYVKSKDFMIKKNGTSPASGYMFWDTVHPSADVHALLADKFCEIYREKFNFTAPADRFKDAKEYLERDQLLNKDVLDKPCCDVFAEDMLKIKQRQSHYAKNIGMFACKHTPQEVKDDFGVVLTYGTNQVCD